MKVKDYESITFIRLFCPELGHYSDGDRISTMPKYKIIYDRKNCIGVGSCAILAEKFWKMAQDDKAQLVGAKKINEDLWELEIDESVLYENKEAARNCPVGVIKIFDENGKQISP